MLDVICFGEILWDIFENAPPRARQRFARDFRLELGGAPANVATGLARLGVRVGLVGGVGRDALGDGLLAHLRSDGVDTRFVLRLPNRTGVAFVTRNARGEPAFLFYRHESADLALRASHIVAPMTRARWVLLGTSTYITPDLATATDRFLQLADRAGALVFLDLNVRPHLWASRAGMREAIGKLAARAALIKASDADLEAVGGSAIRRWLARRAPNATALVTRGAAKMTAVGTHAEVEMPALRARCVDATGAGDAFIAGALATLVATRTTPEAKSWLDPHLWRWVLRAGRMMGRKAVSRAGAVAGLHDLEGIRATVRAAAQGR